MCFLAIPFWMKRNLIGIISQYVLVFKIFYYSYHQNFSLTRILHFQVGIQPLAVRRFSNGLDALQFATG